MKIACLKVSVSFLLYSIAVRFIVLVASSLLSKEDFIMKL